MDANWEDNLPFQFLVDVLIGVDHCVDGAGHRVRGLRQPEASAASFAVLSFAYFFATTHCCSHELCRTNVSLRCAARIPRKPLY
jgi:hypothetical protein